MLQLSGSKFICQDVCEVGGLSAGAAVGGGGGGGGSVRSFRREEQITVELQPTFIWSRREFLLVRRQIGLVAAETGALLRNRFVSCFQTAKHRLSVKQKLY